MLSFIKNWGTSFQTASFTESHGILDNPGRGWYRIYTYRLGEEEAEGPVRYEDETLALVLMNIGAYKERDLDDAILTEMDRILKGFEELGFDLILRICYDTEGKGMVREPSLFSQVKKHLLQIAPLLLLHGSHIFVFQGLLIGNWGEMHGSRYLLPKCLKELAETFLQETKGCIPLAFRKPCQYRTAFSENAPAQRIGFFNDGMLGSETHLGTFGPSTDGRGAWQEPWGVLEELKFMEQFTKSVPFGGEALMPPMPLTQEKVTETFRELGVAYLNSTHDAALLERWKTLNCGEISFYQRVGELLGYRFLIKKVQGRMGKKLEISAEIENEGFGRLYGASRIAILGSHDENDPGDVILGELSGSLEDLGGGRTGLFSGSLALDALQGQNAPVYLFAKIVRERDGRRIRFAQEDVRGCVFLGTFRKN